MIASASPFETAFVLAAVGWPLAAGLAVTLRSQVRSAREEGRAAASERLSRVIEALEEAQAMRARTPSRSPLTRA